MSVPEDNQPLLVSEDRFTRREAASIRQTELTGFIKQPWIKFYSIWFNKLIIRKSGQKYSTVYRAVGKLPIGTSSFVHLERWPPANVWEDKHEIWHHSYTSGSWSHRFLGHFRIFQDSWIRAPRFIFLKKVSGNVDEATRQYRWDATQVGCVVSTMPCQSLISPPIKPRGFRGFTVQLDVMKNNPPWAYSSLWRPAL